MEIENSIHGRNRHKYKPKQFFQYKDMKTVWKHFTDATLCRSLNL